MWPVGTSFWHGVPVKWLKIFETKFTCKKFEKNCNFSDHCACNHCGSASCSIYQPIYGPIYELKALHRQRLVQTTITPTTALSVIIIELTTVHFNNFLLFFFLLSEGSIGCAPPEFKIVRPKKAMYLTTMSTTTTTVAAAVATGTDQPYVAFETTQIYLPSELATANIQIVESGVAAIVPAGSSGSGASSAAMIGARPGSDGISESIKYVNPFWWQEGVQNSDTFTTTTLSPEELAAKKERRRQRKERKRRRRRKHKQGERGGGEHSKSSDDEVASQLRRRREVWNDKYYQEDNYAEAVFDASEIEPNIFNENDTKPISTTYNTYHTDSFSDVLDRNDNNVQNDLNRRVSTVRHHSEKDVNEDDGEYGESDMGLNNYDNTGNIAAVDRINSETVDEDQQIDQRSGPGVDIVLDTDITVDNSNGNGDDSTVMASENGKRTKGRNNNKNNQNEKHFVRHKRKSGKTTGALSRAKAGSSDKGSKSIDRHNKGGK